MGTDPVPCWRCGEDDIAIDSSGNFPDWFQAHCCECDHVGPVRKTEAKAIVAWNREAARELRARRRAEKLREQRLQRCDTARTSRS